MRILLDYRPALRQRTGVGEYVHELARALLAAHGPDAIQLTLFSSSWSDRLQARDLAPAEISDHRIPVSVLNYLWHRVGWPTVEAVTRQRFDVAHAAHPIRLPSASAAQVVTVHDLDFVRHPERTRAEIRRDYPALAPDHIRRADAVIAVSPHTARDIEALTGRPASEVFIAPLGRPDWPRRLDEPADGVLLFFGTLDPRKNVLGLLDAYERLRAGRNATGLRTPPLVVAGGGGSDADEVRMRATSRALAGHVKLTGYIAPETRQDLYRQALALVMPSRTEGFGLPALEAMTIGVPVVASDQGALPDLLQDAGLLCDASTPEGLAAAIAQVLDDQPRRQQMRARGWHRAEAFSWAATAQRTREAWTAAIDRRRRNRPR